MYTVTNKRLGKTWTHVNAREIGSLLVDVAGGGYTQEQTMKAMELREQLTRDGKLSISTLEIVMEHE